MLSRQDYEKRELEHLAPYASKALQSLGRVHQENQQNYRTCFQRDRDRIIHSSAFRRLEYKTQVFVNHEGDYYRTRLTHTLEVAQISRSIARTLRLNEDLAEAIALAHDLGHTPFGHRGEEVMNELMEAHGGFEHNHQSYRVITKLERRYADFDGLNLSFEVREGVAKHSGEYDKPNILDFPEQGYPSLEAQVVDLADQIAYMNHDLDDGLKSEMINLKQLEEIQIWSNIYNGIKAKHPNAREKILKHQTIRTLINLLINDLQQQTLKKIKQLSINSSEDIRTRGNEVVSFSKEMLPKTKNLLAFLYENLYRHPRVESMAQKTEKVVKDLFNIFLSTPDALPASLFQTITNSQKPHRCICDYIAGMTDRFAIDEHNRLSDKLNFNKTARSHI